MSLAKHPVVSLEPLLEDKLNDEWRSPPVLMPLSIAVADHKGLKAMDLAPFLMAKSYTQFFFFLLEKESGKVFLGHLDPRFG